jgi:hypothetical protein
MDEKTDDDRAAAMPLTVTLGRAYMFKWLGREMPGVAIRNKRGRVTMRQKGPVDIDVSVRDVLRELPRVKK